MALSIPAKVGMGVVLVGAAGYLFLSDTGEGIFDYVEVDRVAEAPDRYSGRDIKIIGTVVEGSIQQRKGSSADYVFEIESKGRRMKVHYTDMVPDTFQDGSPVELLGRLNAAGDTIESSQMSAKCPSKYEEQMGAELPQT